MKRKALLLVVILAGLWLSACVSGPDFVVNSPGDEMDSNVGDGVCETSSNDCSLRAAIMEANHDPDVNHITFSGVTEIKPNTPLPPLTAGNIHIDGNAAVKLDGSLISAEENHGLVIEASSFNSIQGMMIRYFDYGIYIKGSNGTATQNTIGVAPGTTGDGTESNLLVWNKTGIVITGQNASYNTIAGNHIGTGTGGLAAKSNELAGILIGDGAHHNLIGSLTSNSFQEGANLISANEGAGIHIAGADNNHISGNIIGLKINGNGALPNGEGIRIINADFNVIGISPNGDGYGNLISGNLYEGITLENVYATTVAGNLIGTNASGTSAVPNRSGIYLTNGSSQNWIGTNGDGYRDADEGNLISGNQKHGVRILDNTTIHNVIAGNNIGTNQAGSAAIGNGMAGVSVSGDMNLIGTDGDGVSDDLEGNLISGNLNAGIILNAFSAHVRGNLIGTDATGMLPLGNTYDGIMINTMSHGNQIGTNGDGVSDILERNIISANAPNFESSSGIDIKGDDNIIAGNFIGTDITGSAGMGNSGTGITVYNTASGNLIGTDGDGTADGDEANLISGNGRGGVWMFGAFLNQVAGNKIGTDFTGSLAIPNSHALNESVGAVQLSHGASGNIIGTNSDGSGDAQEGNLISGNSRRGIVIEGGSTHGNVVAGNYIGTDSSGTGALGNQLGVEINGGSYLNQLGTNGDGNADFWERNLISGNSGPGVSLEGSDNKISGNYIGTDASGTGDLGNGTYGIYLIADSTNNTIGGSTLETNIIAFNGKDGIMIRGDNSTGNLITANSIFENDENGIDLADGTGAWSNPNDPGDVDSGPNDLLNYPLLNSASSLNIAIAITGQIVNGLPLSNFQIDFYANDACDSPANFGEGKTYIGSTAVTTDSGGNVSFLANLNGLVPAGKYITATASHSGSTSEFSECVAVTAATTYMEKADEEEFPCEDFISEQMSVVTSFVDEQSGLFTLYVKNPAGYPGSDSEDTGDGIYNAVLGDITAARCYFQGFQDRLYCNFIVPTALIGTAQRLEVTSSWCGPPIYINDNVTIFRRPPTCSSDLGEDACLAAGGSYQCELACSCVCP